jgi:DNA-binding response OmpR family regulator
MSRERFPPDIHRATDRAASVLFWHPFRNQAKNLDVWHTSLRKELWKGRIVDAMRILIAEDDAPLASFLRKGLESEHYAVDVAGDGEVARDLAVTYDYDLMLLDLNLPKKDGLAVLNEVRSARDAMPILVLTGRSRVEDRVGALDQGADDYVVKPFSFSELSARVRALLRRGKLPAQTTLQVDDLLMDRVERRVERAGQRIELTSKEFALLEYLMRNSGRCITRAMIIEHVWNISFDTSTNVVDVYINYLRKKVDESSPHKLIQTVRGVGYVLSRQEVSSVA